MACVVAQKIALDVAARVEVVRAGARRAAVGPELDPEEARRGGLRADAGALLARGRQQDRTAVAIRAPLGEQPDGAAPGKRVQAAFGGRVAVAGGSVEAACVRAGRADRPAPPGPAMRLVAPGGTCRAGLRARETARGAPGGVGRTRPARSPAAVSGHGRTAWAAGPAAAGGHGARVHTGGRRRGPGRAARDGRAASGAPVPGNRRGPGCVARWRSAGPGADRFAEPARGERAAPVRTRL